MMRWTGHVAQIQEKRNAYQIWVIIIIIIIIIIIRKKIMFLGSKVRLVRKADNLTAIYEPIV
jgi:hypothetical protein